MNKNPVSKRWIKTLSFLCIFAFCCLGSSIHVMAANKSYREEGYWADGRKYFFGSAIYDENGHLTSTHRQYYTYQGDFGDYYTYYYTYDESGRLIEDYYNHELMKYYQTKYEYDNQNRVTKLVHMLNNNPTYDTIYVYDENGNYQIIEDNACYETHRFEYYANGNVKSETTKYSVYIGEMNIQTDYYDESGKLNYSQIFCDDVLVGQTFYDEKGKVIKEYEGGSSYEEAPYGSIWNYSYDPNGNLVNETMTYKDGDSYLTTYEYDAQGYKIKENHFDSYGQLNYYILYIYKN